MATGYDACFVSYDAREDRTLRVNEAECGRPLGTEGTTAAFMT
jgi:hypothetical protein